MRGDEKTIFLPLFLDIYIYIYLFFLGGGGYTYDTKNLFGALYI